MKKLLLLAMLAVFLPTMALASIDTNLYYGVKNQSAVQELQEFLADKDFFKGPITGNFYSITLRAVKAYQASRGIITTGYVGVLTRAAINSELEAELEASNAQSIEDTGALPQLNQPTQSSPLSQPAPTGNSTSGQQTMNPLNITVTASLYPSNSLGIGVSDPQATCRLVVQDANGSIYRNGSIWFKDSGGNNRQVVDLGPGPGRKFTWKVDCEKAGFIPFSKQGEVTTE